MAQDPNAPADDHGNGNGNGDPNGDGAPKTQLELAMDNLLELGIPNLQPLDYTEDQMTKGTVGEMNDWAKKNLDAASYQSYRALRRKESKIEWLVLKIKSINEARGSLLARLQGVAPVVQQQQVQQQQQPGEQGGDQDQDMKENDNGNGNKKGETDAGEDKTEKRLKTMETAILNMQNMFNQVLDKQYGGNNNGTKNGTSKNANDEKLDENEKKKMNEDIARIMNTQRVENGSNVCFVQIKQINSFAKNFLFHFLDFVVIHCYFVFRFFILHFLLFFIIFIYFFHFFAITLFHATLCAIFCLHMP